MTSPSFYPHPQLQIQTQCLTWKKQRLTDVLEPNAAVGTVGSAMDDTTAHRTRLEIRVGYA